MSFTPAIIDTDLYDEIRQRLGNASESVVSDAIIEGISYLQKAEALVKQRVENWSAISEEETSDDLVFLKTAVIALTAYFMLPLVQKLLKSENIQDYSYSNFSVDDWKNKKQELLAEYNASVASITDEEIEQIPVNYVAGPTRKEDAERISEC